MSISLIIGNNIKTLMESSNVSNRKLSEVIGITHPTMAKYLDGSQAIDSDKLMQIASFFNKPFDYFFKEEHSNIQFMFRADKPKSSTRKMDFQVLHGYINEYWDVMGEENLHYFPPKYSIHNTNKEETVQLLMDIARHQRVCANIENIVPENYYEVMQRMGIHVIAKDWKHDDYFGASSLSNEYGSYILINDSPSIPEERKIFSLIHEYAHLLFHSLQYNNQEYDAYYKNGRFNPEEKIANQFAGYFLVPLPMVKEYLKQRENNKIDLIEMKKYFKVSLQTLYVVLHDYQLISDADYQNFWKTINKMGYKTVELSPIPRINLQDKNRKLVAKIKHLYVQDQISANKISEVLGMDALKTRSLLKRVEKHG